NRISEPASVNSVFERIASACRILASPSPKMRFDCSRSVRDLSARIIRVRSPTVREGHFMMKPLLTRGLLTRSQHELQMLSHEGRDLPRIDRLPGHLSRRVVTARQPDNVEIYSQ